MNHITSRSARSELMKGWMKPSRAADASSKAMGCAGQPHRCRISRSTGANNARRTRSEATNTAIPAFWSS
eukprot:635527-Lingulodinium_polyedra.AAC.1